MSADWFNVDKNGLGKQAEEHGKGRLIGELIQNALDEHGVTRVDVTLAVVSGRPLADVVVEDDAPEGFRDLSHAYTLFAESYKRTEPTQRGQFDLGEKFVLAVCESARVFTTKGTVRFDPTGRTTNPRAKRPRGSVFEGRIRMTREQYADVCDYLRSLLVPEHIVLTFNGDRLLPRQPIRSFPATLQTPIADELGVMRLKLRDTFVGLFEPLDGETPSLYELGLPIVETGDKWHVNVGQKIPLNRDRDNVQPAYLRAIRALVLNNAHDLLTKDDANQSFVREGSSHASCSAEAINKVLDLRFGSKRASYDPSDPEANKKWVSLGGTLVYGAMLNANEWKKAKESEAIQPAGQLCPTAKPYSLDPTAPLADFIPPENWTDGMKNIAAYATFLAHELMGIDITVIMVQTPNKFAACYGPGRLDFNVLRLGHKWFSRGATMDVDQLLIHEFGHQYSGDHLSSEYHEALCELGARLKRLALDKPDALKQFSC